MIDEYRSQIIGIIDGRPVLVRDVEMTVYNDAKPSIGVSIVDRVGVRLRGYGTLYPNSRPMNYYLYTPTEKITLKQAVVVQIMREDTHQRIDQFDAEIEALGVEESTR